MAVATFLNGEMFASAVCGQEIWPVDMARAKEAKNSMPKAFDVLVVGGGRRCLAAIYAARKGIRRVCRERFGGGRDTLAIENFISVKNGRARWLR